jgi:DNA helicase II / ATP-dependent DNA helicase PcrA
MAFNPTDEQRAVLAHDLRRHGRILAGPGTGKSATLITLFNSATPDTPIRAKLLTFTRAATAELAHKLSEAANVLCERPSTVHSFCISVLLSNPGVGEFPEPFRMADDWENREIVRPTLARRLAIGVQQVKELFAELAANWESLAPEERPGIEATVRARFMGGWQQHREIYGYTLPSELPHTLLRALQQHEDLEGIQYDILIVDEYQDLNACDLAVLRALADRGCAIIGAGDDDQSIYSFRKAHPEGIRRFPRDYDGAADYPLSITQRCGRRIVEWANFVIQGDPDRPAARGGLRCGAGASEGEVALLSFAGEVAEARGIAALTHDLITRRDIQPSEILILMRSDHNGQFSNRIKQELEQKGIAFSDPEAVNEILEHDANRRALSLMRLAVHREDSLAWATLLHLAGGIGPTFNDHIYIRARDARSTFGHALLAEFASDFAGAPRSSTRAAPVVEETVRWLEAHPPPEQMPEDGWARWISDTFPAGVTTEITNDFRELLGNVDDHIEETDELGSYLSQIGPVARDLALAKSDGVRIMTLAGSKGLTVEATILCGLESGLVPMDGRDLAEERRLLYVGMTRAKRFLFGTWARIRRGPTARAGRGRANERRRSSIFLDNGPIQSQDGNEYLASR